MNNDISIKMQELRNIQNSLETMSKRLDSINFNDIWEGTASELFLNNIKGLKSEFRKLDNSIDETLMKLRKCIK